MKIKTNSTTCMMLLGAGNKKILELLRKDNKRAPARLVKRAWVLIAVKRINAIPRKINPNTYPKVTLPTSWLYAGA